MTETAKKKRGMPSSFTILLALLAIVAVITVIVSGTSGGAVTAARLSDFCTAPIKGFADALPVCLFVMILGGFLGMMTETGALDNGIAVLVQKLKGNEIMLIPVLMLIFSLRWYHLWYVRGDRSLLRPARRYHDGCWLRPHGRCRYRPARRWLRLPGLHG